MNFIASLTSTFTKLLTSNFPSSYLHAPVHCFNGLTQLLFIHWSKYHCSNVISFAYSCTSTFPWLLFLKFLSEHICTHIRYPRFDCILRKHTQPPNALTQTYFPDASPISSVVALLWGEWNSPWNCYLNKWWHFQNMSFVHFYKINKVKWNISWLEAIYV